MENTELTLQQKTRKNKVQLLTEQSVHLIKELAALPREQYKRGRWYQIKKRLRQIRKELSNLGTLPPEEDGEQIKIKLS